MKIIEKTIQAIKKFDKFLITSHMNLEGDSLGSQLAMANLLSCLGKDFIIFDNDRPPSHFRFLPQVDLVQHKIDIDKETFDAAIVLDCPNLRRTGKVRNTVKEAKYIINIDHHVSNEKFGDINWVEKDTSSTGEMIYKLCKALDCKITKETALYLYIAILTDTGSFNYSNTSSATHEIVSKLLGYGIEPYSVSRNIYGNKTLGDLKLLGRALSDIKVIAGGKIAYMTVRKSLFSQTNTKPQSCENFVNFARSIQGVEVAIFFREDIEKKNVSHVSFRSTGNADVNKLAAAFGGGGHKKAAGCTVRSSFEEVKRKVLKRARDEF